MKNFIKHLKEIENRVNKRKYEYVIQYRYAVFVLIFNHVFYFLFIAPLVIVSDAVTDIKKYLMNKFCKKNHYYK